MRRFVCLFLLCALAGCDPAAKFSVTEVGKPSLSGLDSLHGLAVVNNNGRRDLVIESADLVVRYRERELGTARLARPVVIPARKSSEVGYGLVLESLSLPVMLSLQSRAADPGQIEVDVSGLVRLGGMRRKVEIKGMTLAQIMEIVANFDPL